MEFHISRAVRQFAKVDARLFSYTGNVVFANVTASRHLAQALTEARIGQAPEYNAGALFAMGLIDELSHALVAKYRREIDPDVLKEALRWFKSRISPEDLEALLLEFTQQFPNAEIYQGQISASEWLDSTAADGLPNRDAAVEELLMLFLANSNPAFRPFSPLFDDKQLKDCTLYTTVTAAFPEYFATRPPLAVGVGSLFNALRAPFLASPDSLTGQLDFIREHWTPYLGEDLRRVLLAIDTLREEDVALWLRFHPPGPHGFGHGTPKNSSEGFVGDEFVGFDDDLRRRRKYSHDYQAPLEEYEAFSTDQAWMPNVVLIAKSTYVWLEQLSKKYGRHIYRLDQIPEEELRLLADRGITGLWLIGLWERSVASRTIKRLRGAYDAVASAYSLKSYDIAEDLGGWEAYNTLKYRAAAAGMRLASDMVPNHMGIDSPWVIDNPDWFLYRWESPFPSYTFTGPDLSTDSRVEIKIEDHYYDQTDAAVVFRLLHHAGGGTRYIYHGNDGTTFAWNDTAQLDYSKAAVREHVIQTILHVARLFPIIRFDAAMVLAKRHVQRLWFPLPGAGGSIPSRAENAMSQEEFDAIMPHEFWREVVDRVAAEVPGTLLLAEAFWMLEGYFVRTLGMHRVYNSAFMNMLRDEENAKYRSYLKKTIEFDPDILKRYVNFMSNPDERTAIDQFGDGDKCFGVATLMATLPGLPMFGHGQIEGFTERYGMEFKQAKMEEWPKDWLVQRHMREIAPLLKKRYIFAGSENFVMYDFWTGYGTVNENVFAYSNRHQGERSLVLYNNKYDETEGTIHVSVPMMDKASGALQQRNVSDGLGLPNNDEVLFAYRDSTRNLEYLLRANDLYYKGLHVQLWGFQTMVLLDWRELHASDDHPWDRLCDELQGRGVTNLDYELAKLRLRPLHDLLASVLSPANVLSLASLAEQPFNEQSKPSSVAHNSVSMSDGVEVDNYLAPENVISDEDLLSLTAAADSFLEALPAYLPEHAMVQAPGHTLNSKSSGNSDTRSRAEPQESPAPSQANSQEFRDSLVRAVLLPTASSFLTDWLPESRPILPTYRSETRQLRTWAPILAYLLLRHLPGREPKEIFDRLLLRHALADAFASLGMEGDARWQAAAQVRLLLRDTGRDAAYIRSEAFFSDPDVVWLTGTNTSSGTRYVNKEQFLELVAWLQLPILIEIAGDTSAITERMQALNLQIGRTLRGMEHAEYQLDQFLNPDHISPMRKNTATVPDLP